MKASLNAEERRALINEYDRGPRVLRAAWETIPADIRQWRPAADKWSSHEVVIHCADSETYAATRIRLVAAEKDPLIVAYDQDAWAQVYNYHSQSTDHALRTIEAVRSGTLAILNSLSEADWWKEGRHTETGRYTACDWLRSYGPHLTNHAKQIERNLAAFRAA